MKEHIALLVGGVGGAKLAYGLAQILSPESLSIIVNTADDFEHLGLHVSPDVDTVMYTLAGLSNKAQGWGLEGDSLQAIEMIKRLGGPGWFNLGDIDLGTNLMRTAMLSEGKTLTEITAHIATALGVQHTILPMTDDRLRTELETNQGRFVFQEYFVRERWQPVVKAIEFVGASDAHPSGAVRSALAQASALIVGPSNPFLSIDPILAVGEIRQVLETRTVPVIAVSPIVSGKALKGPAAKLLHEFGLPVSAVSVAEHYRGLIDAIVVDETDVKLKQSIENFGIHCVVKPTVMTSDADKVTLAESLMQWIRAYPTMPTYRSKPLV